MTERASSISQLHPRIAVFAREPLLGHVKSRLAKEIGEASALVVYRAMLARVTGLLGSADIADWDLWVTSNIFHKDFITNCNKTNIYIQEGADLGAKMSRTIELTLQREDANAAVVIGTDCPALTADYLQKALDALSSGVDVVLGPAEDGGYVLIGMGQPHPTLFSTIDWGTDRVMAQTLEAIGACGLSYQLLDTLWDVDRPEDLQRLRLLNPPLDWDGG